MDEKLNLEDEVILTLELEDGTEEDCVVLSVFPMDGRQYIALTPADQLDSEDGEIYLYRYCEDAEGNPVLDDIEDDEEFDAVCDRFDEVCDEEDFDEIDI